jgi:hypothetical protein
MASIGWRPSPLLNKIRESPYDFSGFLIGGELATVNLPPGVTLEQSVESEQFSPAPLTNEYAYEII